MMRRRRISPWARIALREPALFRWWAFCRAPAAPKADSPAYDHTILIALLLPLLGWLAAWLEPALGLAMGGAAVPVALWIPFAGWRMRRIRAHCLEHVRRRHARRSPQMPEWGWALMRAQERSVTFSATHITNPFCTAIAVIGFAVMMTSFNPQVQEWLGAEHDLRGAMAPTPFSALPLPAGAALLTLALAAGFVSSERDRRRLRRAMLDSRCLRCGYVVVEPALRQRLRCPVCPECGYRYPLHRPRRVATWAEASRLCGGCDRQAQQGAGPLSGLPCQHG